MDYEESDNDWEDDDYYEDDQYDDDDVADTIDCPECGLDVYEDADICPGCGHYVHHGYDPGRGYPWWSFGGAIEDWSPFSIFLAMLGVLVLIFALMGGFAW